MPIINVADYGAKADGTTDDTDAINNALTAAGTLAARSGMHVGVSLMAGTHLVSYRPMAENSSYYGAVQVPSNVHLSGYGRDVSTIKLAAHSDQPNGGIFRNTSLGGGDFGITLSDFTVDGDGANQTVLNNGVGFLRAHDLAVTRVLIKNVFGNSGYPPGETFHLSFDSCVRVQVTDCLVFGTAGTQGSGFADNSCTAVTYTGCQSVGMSAGMGYATWHGSNISYANCRAFLCGAHAFNAEFGKDIIYTACIAGGEASDQASGYVWANNQSLGSASSGFCINGITRAVLDGCISRRNDTGVSVVAGSAQVIGGFYNDNTSLGLYFGGSAVARASVVSSSTVVATNGGANWAVNDGTTGVFSGTDALPGPAIPSGVTVANPFPFQVVLYVKIPSYPSWVRVNGVDVGSWASSLVLNPGDTVRFVYSRNPGFAWMRS